MKKSSAYFSLISGIVLLFAGIYEKPKVPLIFLGIILVILPFLSKLDNRKKKQKGNEIYTLQQKQQAVLVLRKNIIEMLEIAPLLTYELSGFCGEDVARYFPSNYSFNWHGVCFKLDLQTQKLYADVDTYPNQCGSYREDRYNLTASEFHRKAIEFNMSKELRCMETDADWKELFDDELNDAILQALKKSNSNR